VYLLAELFPPAGLPTGVHAVLCAKISWLACRVECTPGSAQLSLTLPAKAGAPGTDARWAERLRTARISLPSADPSVHLSAETEGKQLVLRAPLTSVGAGLAKRKGLVGSFFSGFLATAVATPCTAPFMGTALGFALSPLCSSPASARGDVRALGRNRAFAKGPDRGRRDRRIRQDGRPAEEHIILPELLTPGVVLDALARL